MKKMKGYNGGDSTMKKDYQPGDNQFAGKQMGKANEYMARADKICVKSASKIKAQAHKGRYD